MTDQQDENNEMIELSSSSSPVTTSSEEEEDEQNYREEDSFTTYVFLFFFATSLSLQKIINKLFLKYQQHTLIYVRIISVISLQHTSHSLLSRHTTIHWRTRNASRRSSEEEEEEEEDSFPLDVDPTQIQIMLKRIVFMDQRGLSPRITHFLSKNAEAFVRNIVRVDSNSKSEHNTPFVFTSRRRASEDEDVERMAFRSMCLVLQDKTWISYQWYVQLYPYVP